MAKQHLNKTTRSLVALIFLFMQAACMGSPSASAQSSSPDHIPFAEIDHITNSPLSSPNKSMAAGQIDEKDTPIAAGGDTISLDLRGMEISQLLKILSQKLEKNIIPSSKVTGKVTLFLDKVKYDDVLDILVASQGLAYDVQGENLIIVMTEAEYKALYGEKFNEKREIRTLHIKYAQPKVIYTALNSLKSSVGNIVVDEATGTLLLIDTVNKLELMEKTARELDQPIEVEVFELQYAIAAEIKDNIASIVTPGTGSVVTDERTNMIIISDLSGNMEKIRKTLLLLDQETRQVFIEAEIIQITLQDEFRFGINWQAIINDPGFWGATITGAFPIPAAELTNSLAVVFGNDTLRITAIEMLSKLGELRILSSPRLAVINNEEAVILVGTKEAYVTATTSQSGESTITSDNVEFIDTGVKLTVVPTINRDGWITMRIKPSVSERTDWLITGTEEDPRSKIPIITTHESETTVKVKDGSTIMIAGLRKYRKENDIDGIPFLSKIPILGKLFSVTYDNNRDEEIIIFITPHIITGENMMSWDKEKMEKFPLSAQPQNKGYVEPKFNKNKLKRLTRQKRR
jgi:type II secretory pathway component GspD/PulD (secretin)